MKTKVAAGVLVAAGVVAAIATLNRSECVKRPLKAPASACMLRFGPSVVDQGDRVIRRELSVGTGCEAASCR